MSSKLLLIPSALTPFHSDDAGTLYTSETARYTRTFGYTYPEIIDWNVNSSQLSSNVRTKLNALYNPTGEATKRSSPMKRAKAAAQYPNAANHQWFVNIRVDKYVYSIYLVQFDLIADPSNKICPILVIFYSLFPWPCPIIPWNLVFCFVYRCLTSSPCPFCANSCCISGCILWSDLTNACAALFYDFITRSWGRRPAARGASELAYPGLWWQCCWCRRSWKLEGLCRRTRSLAERRYRRWIPDLWAINTL